MLMAPNMPTIMPQIMPPMMSPIADKLQAVRASIARAAHAVSRDPQQVLLLAVSKTFGVEAVLEAVQAGQTAFGENYLQEALEKIARLRTLLPDKTLEWHFIGPIQSNKTRLIAEQFAWVHTVDRLRIAQRLSEQRPPDMPPVNICLQVNISGEASKSGVMAVPEQVLELAQAVAALPRIRLRGLMAIPESEGDFAAQRLPFGQLRQLLTQLQAAGLALDTLSMGMSADMAAAIAEGATIVRVGSAIFGQRTVVKTL
jgi:pyridoxal phosphate enzyme (YggS family)